MQELRMNTDIYRDEHRYVQINTDAGGRRQRGAPVHQCTRHQDTGYRMQDTG